MRKYTKGMVVFGLGLLIVSMWCMKGTEAEDDEDEDSIPIVHAVRREDPPEGCGPNNTGDGGVQVCTDEDDHLGLYADIDDTFKATARKVASQIHLNHHHQHQEPDAVDSPDVAHNNINVLGH